MSWLPQQKIVIAVDFTADSERAADVALELAGSPDRLHLVNVLFPLESILPSIALGDVNDEKRAREVEANFSAFLAKRNLAGCHTSVRFGDPAHEIVGYAKEVGADLIVIPSHGYHGVKRMLLGSVAEGVLRHTECSVLVLRRENAE